MNTTRITLAGFFVFFSTTVACSPVVRTEVRTLSERAPVEAASFRVVLNDDQTEDLESNRLARQIDERMRRVGFRPAGAEGDAEVTVRFEAYADTEVARRPEPSFGMGATSTTTTSSGTSLAGIPLTRSTTTRHDPAFGAELSSGTAAEAFRRYRLELQFSDADGPSHKVTVSADAGRYAFDELSACLVEAAFREFPHGDGSSDDVSVPLSDCRQG